MLAGGGGGPGGFLPTPNQFNTGGLITQRTQDSLDIGNHTEFQLEDMMIQKHTSREQLATQQQQMAPSLSNRGEILYAPKIDERSEE